MMETGRLSSAPVSLHRLGGRLAGAIGHPGSGWQVASTPGRGAKQEEYGKEQKEDKGD